MLYYFILNLFFFFFLIRNKSLLVRTILPALIATPFHRVLYLLNTLTFVALGVGGGRLLLSIGTEDAQHKMVRYGNSVLLLWGFYDATKALEIVLQAFSL